MNVNAPNVERLAATILALRPGHPIRVGIDGFCAAGKTTLASAVGVEIEAGRRGIIRATTDDFQNPPEIRWQLGDRSSVGFLRHQIDFVALRSHLLEPLGPGGTRRYRTSTYDVYASRPRLSPEHVADPMDILLLDGLFLHSSSLAGCFDFTIFVSAPYETCLVRARARNQERSHDLDELEAVYRERYIPGFRRYCEESEPQVRASIVVET